MSKYEVHNLARSMDVTESYIYTLVRRGVLKATQTRPVHIDADTVKEFYKDKIPTDLFELKHKNNINKISITSKPYVHINSSYFKMGGSKYASS
tara:strand:- start:138 stop:419 length:282 start_codon:yes stop_codon:yes gene_type:complete